MIDNYIPASKKMSSRDVFAVIQKLYPAVKRKDRGEQRNSSLTDDLDENMEVRHWMVEHGIDETKFRSQLEYIFQIEISDQAWQNVQADRIRQICKLVSESGAYKQPISALKIAKTNCLLAGIFLAVRSSLHDAGLSVKRSRPSSALSGLSSQDMGSLTVALAKLAPSVVLTPVPSGWEAVGRWSFQGISTIGDLCREIEKVYAASDEEDSGSSALQLTKRELQVLRLLSLGLTNKAMAKELNVTVETIKTHMKHIMTKMSATGRTEVIVKAIESGLVSL